jgi:branched-chain amino acid transport system ATP-binding protein
LAASDETAVTPAATTATETGAAGPAPAPVEGTLLQVTGLQAGYGAKQVVFDVSLNVGAGEIVGIVGHNGAGKTTTLNTIFGILRPRGGQVVYRGENIAGRTCHKNVLAGMTLVPSEQFVFSDLSVAENLQLGALWTSPSKRPELLESVYQIFPVIKDNLKMRAGQFSGGQQRMLSIGMALMADPKFMLFDEPSLGLAPAVTIRVFDTLRQLVNERGISVLILEQNMPQLLRVVDRVYVMRSGRVAGEETVEQLRAREHYWDIF